MPTCGVCGESFLQVIKLKLHMRSHDKEAAKGSRQVVAPVANPADIDKLKGNPVVLLRDASISKVSPKQPSAQQSKGELPATSGATSNSIGQPSATKTGNLVSLKSSTLAKRDTKVTDNAKTSAATDQKTCGPHSKKLESVKPEEKHEEDQPRMTRATVKAEEEGKESASNVEKKNLEINEKTTVSATKRMPERPRPGPLSSKKPRLASASPVKRQNESPVKNQVEDEKKATKQELVKDEDTEMKDLELTPCPWDGCIVKCRPGTFYTHMAEAHEQHICQMCGEAKDSAAILEEHKLKRACTTKKRKGKKAPKSNASASETKDETKEVTKEDIVNTKEPQSVAEEELVVEPTRKKHQSSSLDMDSLSDIEDKIIESFFDGTKCKGCPKVFRKVNRKLMVAHYENDCSGNPKFTISSYKCDSCDQLFDRKAILDNHVRLAHAQKITCDCDLQFDTKQEYELHWNTTHGRKKRQSPRGGISKRGRFSPRKGQGRPSYDERKSSSSSESSYHPSPASLDGANEELKKQGTEVESTAKPSAAQKQNGTTTTNKIVTSTADTTTANEVPTSTIPASVNQGTNSYGPRAHTCKVCETVFYDKMDLAMHLLEHNKEPEFPRAVRKVGMSNATKFLPTEMLQKCVVCGGGFTNQIDLIAHITKEHEKTGTYPCVTCKQVFGIALELYRHTTDKHASTYFATSNPVSTYTHSNTRKTEDGLKCVVCFEKVTTLIELNEHMASEHPERPWFVCSAEGCYSPYSCEKSLNRHLQKDHNIQPIRRM